MEISYKISIVILAFLTFGAAIYTQQKRPSCQWLALLLLLLAGFLLRALCAYDPFLHDWDERFHALVAKHLMNDPLTPQLYPVSPIGYNIENWAANHLWLHKQPLPLWCMAGAMKIMGVHEFVLRIPSVLLSTAVIALTFFMGKWLFSPQVGFWAAFFHSVSGRIIEVTAGRVPTDHVDIFFLCFVQLGVFFAVWQWKYAASGQQNRLHQYGFPFLMGLSVGAAILCKWLPALLVFALVPILLGINKQVIFQLLLGLIACLAVALPWQVYAATHFSQEYWIEQHFNSKHITEVLEGHSGSFLFHFDQARVIWNELVYLPLLWLLWQLGWQKSTDRRLWMLAAWIFIPYLFFSFVKTKMPNYVLFTGPAIFLLTAHFLSEIVPKKWGNWKNALWSLFVLLALRYCIERVKPTRNDAPLLELRAKITALKQLENPGTRTFVFNSPNPIETMFYTDLIAYQRLPHDQEVATLTTLKDRIIILDGQTLSDSLRADPRVTVISY